MRLYCEMNSARVLIQSIFPIGSFIGLIIVNLLSDTRGRKFALQLTISICLAGILCTFFFNVSNFVRRCKIKCCFFTFRSVCIRIWLLSYNPIGVYNTLWFFERLLSPCCCCDHQLSWVIFFIYERGFATFLLGIIYLMSINWFNFLVVFILIPLIVLLAIVYFFLQ